MVGIRVARIELDEVWGFVGKEAEAREVSRSLRKGRPVRFHSAGLMQPAKRVFTVDGAPLAGKRIKELEAGVGTERRMIRRS